MASNNDDDASANGGGGGGGDEAAMVVADQQQPNEDQQPAAANGGSGNEEAEEEDDEETMAEQQQQGENDGEPNATASSSSSRYSLRKRSRKPLLSLLQDNTTTANGGSSKTSRSNATKKQQQSSYQPDPFGYVINAANLTDRQFERLLAQYEEDGVRERAQKKLRRERGYADDDYPYELPAEGCPPLDSLPKECIQRVFELLPSIRAVFNLAYQSKYMLSFVEGRMDIVIRATALEEAHKYGTSRRSTLTGIVRLIRKRSIRVPSALRLLKVINARRCERGADCFAFDLKTGLSSKREMGSYRPYGFAICGTCTNDASNSMPRPWRWRHPHWSRTEGRSEEGKIIFHGWRHLFDPDKGSDLCVGPDGEQIGPFINAKHLRLITNIHWNANVEKEKEMFATIVENEYGKEGSDEMEAFDKACTDLVQIYDQATEECETRREKHYEKKTEESREKGDVKVAAKKANLEPIIEALEEALADAPLKELALEYEWKNNADLPLVEFKYHFVKDSIGKLISAPSSATHKKVKAAFSSIRRKLEILSATSQGEGDEGESDGDFFSLSFLSTAHEGSSSSLKKRALQKMLDYCRNDLSGGMKTVIGGQHNDRWDRSKVDMNGTTDRFFDLLEGGPDKYVDAVLHILSARKALGNIVSEILVSSTSTSTGNHRDLAKAVWKKMVDEMEAGFTQASFYETLSLCRTEFRTMKNNAKDYLEEAEVKQFLASGGNWNRDRIQQSVDQVWNPRNSVIRFNQWSNVNIPADVQNLKPYRLLLDRDFERLLRIHRFYRNHIYTQFSGRASVSYMHQAVPNNAN